MGKMIVHSYLQVVSTGGTGARGWSRSCKAGCCTGPARPLQMQGWADSLNQSLDPVCEHKNLPGVFLKLELPFAKEVLHLYF